MKIVGESQNDVFFVSRAVEIFQTKEKRENSLIGANETLKAWY